ncbi:MAG TPA: hypothetical protein VJ021_07170 [Thermoplasmata archaeon]|nr:hypothetical protein [Thermoplasmata archaeon]
MAAVIIGAAFAFPGRGSSAPRFGTFDFSQNLPTGSIVSNGQLHCGSNVTENLTVPNDAIVKIFFAINQSGDSANVWMTGPGPGNTGFLGVGWGGTTYEELGVGLGGQLEFFLQSCGSGPTVPLGFWGNITSGIHVP